MLVAKFCKQKSPDEQTTRCSWHLLLLLLACGFLLDLANSHINARDIELKKSQKLRKLGNASFYFSSYILYIDAIRRESRSFPKIFEHLRVFEFRREVGCARNHTYSSYFLHTDVPCNYVGMVGVSDLSTLIENHQNYIYFYSLLATNILNQ